MRVLLINTSERIGGAAIAASRLMESLKNHGIKAKLLVRDKQTDQISVVSLDHNWRMVWKFVWERIVIWSANRFNKKNIFAVDIANTGTDITSLPEFQQADVIHLHWINQGMLSLRNIEKILASGKPVVWTMHDMWPCTGICHHARECTRYRQECHNCPFIHGGGGKRDLSYRIFRKKMNLYKGRRINFVTCSHWLEERARTSALFCGHTVTCIPNPHQHQPLQTPQPTGSPQPLPPSARQEARVVRLGEDYGQEERYRLPDRIVPPAGRQASRTPGTVGRGRLRQPVATTGEPASIQSLPAELRQQRTPTGEHLQCRRHLRDPLAGREPAEHHHGSHGVRHSLRRIQRRRHS